MATAVHIQGKTPTTITGSTTKTNSNVVYTDIGRGFTQSEITSHIAGRAASSGGQGSYGWVFSNLQPNTQYGVVAYELGGGTSGISTVQDGTLPPPALSAQTVSNIAPFSAQINFTTGTDGGYHPKLIKYSLDGTTWVNGPTVYSGTPVLAYFEINGLTPHTQYTVFLKATTTVGSGPVTYLSFTTTNLPERAKFYGPANDVAARADSLYGSHGGEAKRMTKLYGSANGDARLIHQEFGHLTYS